MKRQVVQTRFAVCIRNDEAEDLQPRKIYQVLPDNVAAAEGYLRVVDESGEDYLYPEEYFFPIELPKDVERALWMVA